MTTPNYAALGGPGLSVTQFLNSLQGEALEQFLNSEVLSLLAAVGGGELSDDDLRRAIPHFIDFYALLGEDDSRKNILDLVPKNKRDELEARVEMAIYKENSDKWGKDEIRSLRDFFGLIEEKITNPIVVSVGEITPAYGLFNHQRKAIEKIKPLLFEGDRRAVLHLPTGVGKTRVAMHIVAESLRNEDPSIVVWLASGRELLEQAVVDFSEAWNHLGTRELSAYSVWSDAALDFDDVSDGLIVIGLQKAYALSSGVDENWALKLSSKIRLVVFDEAHQAIAKTYRQVTDHLTLNYRCSLLGLSATPGRTWSDIDKDEELAKFFSYNKVSLETENDNSIEYLINNEYLAQPNFETLLSEPGLNLDHDEQVRISNMLEIPDEIVERLSLSKQYILAIISAIFKLLENGHKRIIVFAATVNHAKILNVILMLKDIRSFVVLATTNKLERKKIIDEFKSDSREDMVLINFGVLTTGFDAPKASAAVIARPTKSLVLYSQMVGRIIRGPKAGGTENCDIITVVDPDLPGFGDVAQAYTNWEEIWK